MFPQIMITFLRAGVISIPNKKTVRHAAVVGGGHLGHFYLNQIKLERSNLTENIKQVAK